jgi:hypothetical protein
VTAQRCGGHDIEAANEAGVPIHFCDGVILQISRRPTRV